MKHKAIFITGTDTGIGKTFYSCRLLEALNANGCSTLAMKPVAAGASNEHGTLKNEDALQLQQCASIKVSYQEVNPYCFSAAIAPHLAANKEGQQVSLKLIHDQFLKLKEKADFVLVEGVGGWQVPLNESQTVADLAKTLQIPVVLVVGIRLGCINHALLTVDSIQQSSVALTGWVANIIEPDMSALDENIKTLQQLIVAPLLDVIQYQADHSKPSLNSTNIDWL
jgi:dethiobiotin synthetase